VRLLSAVRGESAIVFTEYRDTLYRLAALLPDALHLHGGLTHAERADVQRRFNADGGVLLATDAAADGLNLQQRCRLVVNFELPWNPARLEQRIGRVDRIGQRRVVHAVTFVARDTAEDLVVARLARRLARVAATLGERDRLASLVSDVRTARAVIAGVPLEIDGVTDEAPRVPRASSADFDVERIAPQAGRDRTSPDVCHTAVARLRPSRFVGPGLVALLRCAVVEDRGVVADRAFILHVSIPRLSKPTSHREALRLARTAIEQIETIGSARPEVREWMEGVTRVHDEAVTRRIARERQIRHEAPSAVEVQPGLFDPRAMRQAVRLDTEQDDRRRAHDDHLRSLEASRAVRLECQVAALLTRWR
jgi:Helicase conserved C-terminal domain